MEAGCSWEDRGKPSFSLMVEQPEGGAGRSSGSTDSLWLKSCKEALEVIVNYYFYKRDQTVCVEELIVLKCVKMLPIYRNTCKLEVGELKNQCNFIVGKFRV